MAPICQIEADVILADFSIICCIAAFLSYKSWLDAGIKYSSVVAKGICRVRSRTAVSNEET